jgi:hypothetical protein
MQHRNDSFPSDRRGWMCKVHGQWEVIVFGNDFVPRGWEDAWDFCHCRGISQRHLAGYHRNDTSLMQKCTRVYN